MSAKGGKIKASQVFTGISGATGIAAAGSAFIPAVQVAAPFLAAASGVSAGIGKLLSVFGAGFSDKEKARVQKIINKHKNLENRGIHKTPTKTDLALLDRLVRKHKKKGSGISSGGSIKTGGSIRTGGSIAKQKARGSKREVWNGSARRTSGGLTKEALMVNKRGKVVSKKKHAIGLKRFKENKLKPKTKEQLAEMRKKRRK